MSDLKDQFEQAAKDVQDLPSRPDNMTLLKLYALYKQGTDGDVSGSRPGFTDFKGRAKFDAWAEQKGLSKEDAQQAYVDLVKKLKA